MAKSLKELYGLREMAINVPDESVGVLRKIVNKAVMDGELPDEAADWIPRKSKYTAKEPEAQPAAAPKKDDDQKWADAMAKAQAKVAGKGKKGKEPEAPARQPISTDPAVKADLDKSQSAWDALNQKVAEPSPFKSNVKSAPMKGPEFDPTGMHPDYDMPDLGTPKSANVKLNKHGQPLKGADDEHPDPDMFAHKKTGALSRIFGKGKKADQGMAAQPKKGALSRVFGKKQPQFQDNPYEFTPGNDWQKSTADPFAEPAAQKPAKKAPPLPPKSGGEDAMNDLGAFLDKNPAPKAAPARGGDDAMNDLNWDLKRSKGKR